MSENFPQFSNEIKFQNKSTQIHLSKNKNVQEVKSKNKISLNNISNYKDSFEGNKITHVEVLNNNNIFDSLINLNKFESNEDNTILNEYKINNSIEKKLLKAKKEMDNVKENIDKLNKKIINIKNKSEKLEIKKSKYDDELQNLVSNKETLEEMYNMEITFLKDEECPNLDIQNSDNHCEINISKEEIQKININNFIIQIITLINEINKENDLSQKNELNSLSDIISNLYLNLINQLKSTNNVEKKISDFISSISENLVSKLKRKYSINIISSFISYLIKINYFNEQIIKYEKFIDVEYKINKEKIDESMIEITLALLFYEKHKNEILKKTSILQEEINEKRRLKENKYIYEKDNVEEIRNNIEIENNEKFDMKDINKVNDKNLPKNDNKTKIIISNEENEQLSKEVINIDRKEISKNKLFNNYLNHGNELKNYKRINKNNMKYNNSISEYNNKTNIIYNYNFNTNLLDIKPIKRKKENSNKNKLIFGNFIHFNKSKRKKYNSNSKLNEYNTNHKNINLSFLKINTIPNEIKKNKNNIINDKKYKNLLEINKILKYKFKKNKTDIISNESFLTDNKKRNQNYNRILAFKKLLPKKNKKSDINISLENNVKSGETSMKNIRNKINNSNLILNINNNINFDSNVSSRRIKNISNLLTDNINNININLNNIYQQEKTYNIRIKNKRESKITTNPNNIDLKYQLKAFKQGKMESFCYFKFFQTNNNKIKKYDPLNVLSVNPEYFDYYECYISIDFFSSCIKLSPKISLVKINYIPLNNNGISLINNKTDNLFYIEIQLKEIKNIILEKYTQDIIKIQNILLKYDIKINNNFSINKILNKKEINDIKLERNQKIKAVLCNFFPFSFNVRSNTKIELIFINYEQFNIWLNTLNSIVQNNIKLSKIGKSSIKNT